MKQKVLAIFSIVALSAAAAVVFAAKGTDTHRTSFRADEQRALALLPDATGLIILNPADMLQTTIPRFLKNNPSQMAKLQSELRRFEQKTGIDPYAINSVAIAVIDRGNQRDAGGVAIATGRFNEETIAARLAGGMTGLITDVQPEEYRGHRLYIEHADRRGTSSQRTHGAVAFLDSGTMVMGTVDEVENVLDTHDSSRARSEVNQSLMEALGTINPSANVRFVATLGGSLKDVIQRETGNATPVGPLRRVSGSLQLDGSGLTAEVVAEAESAQSANTLVNFVSGGILLARTYLTNHPITSDSQLALDVLNQIRFSTTGPEVRLDVNLPADLINRILAAARQLDEWHSGTDRNRKNP